MRTEEMTTGGNERGHSRINELLAQSLVHGLPGTGSLASVLGSVSEEVVGEREPIHSKDGRRERKRRFKDPVRAMTS